MLNLWKNLVEIHLAMRLTILKNGGKHSHAFFLGKFTLINQPARISRVKWALQDDILSARYSANEIFEHEFWENAYFLEICKKWLLWRLFSLDNPITGWLYLSGNVYRQYFLMKSTWGSSLYNGNIEWLDPIDSTCLAYGWIVLGNENDDKIQFLIKWK